jgi:hypothetical protein
MRKFWGRETFSLAVSLVREILSLEMFLLVFFSLD